MKPEKVFRIGSVSASVFVNEVDTEGGKRKIRNVNLQRSYRDDKGDWQTSTSFGLADLPHVQAVVDLAFQHVADQEAEQSTK